MFKKVLKANPYHDAAGRFTAKGKATFVSTGGVFSKQNSAQAKEVTLTEAETGAARTYSQSGYDYSYGYVNDYLRTGNEPRGGMNEDTMKASVSNLDSAIGKSSLGKDTTAYRGTSLREYGLQSSDDLKPGVVLKDKAFTSTTTDLGVATGGYSSRDSVTLKMKVPKDAPALDMAKERDGKALGEITSEAEVLLPRGMSFKVKSVTGTGRDTIVEVEPVFPSKKVKKGEVVQSIANAEVPMLQVVYGEVYAPNRLDAHNEFMTAEEIRKAAWSFAKKGINKRIDVQHDNKVVANVEVVESFIARDDDPDFLAGSWVLGVHVDDDAIWEKILKGELNGFSMEALVRRFTSDVELDFPDVLTGQTTESRGHVHTFEISYDEKGKLIGGRTNEVEGHYHEIRAGTVTEVTEEHRHGFSAVDGLEFEQLSTVE